MIANAMYFTFSRFLYITCVMTLMITLFCQRAKMVKSFLTLYFWTPLSKLTFIVYLIFPLVIGAGYFATHGDVYHDYLKAIVFMTANTILSYIFAFLLYISIQKPIDNIKALIAYKLASCRRSVRTMKKESKVKAQKFKNEKEKRE